MAPASLAERDAVSDHGRLIPLSTALNVYSYTICICTLHAVISKTRSFIKSILCVQFLINFVRPRLRQLPIFSITSEYKEEGEKEKRRYVENGAVREARYDIPENENIYVYILIFFLREARINGRGQFAYVAERREGPGPFPTLGKKEESRRGKAETGGDCATIYIYICTP